MKKFFSIFLCLGLLLSMAGCNKSCDVNPELENLDELTREEYLAKYNEYLNEEHNIVLVHNILQHAHDNLDDPTLEELYADFKKGVIKDEMGQILYRLNLDYNRKYTDYDQFTGYFDNSIIFLPHDAVKHFSQISFGNVLGDDCPSMLKLDETGKVSDIYVYNYLYTWPTYEGQSVVHFEVNQEQRIGVSKDDHASFTFDEDDLIKQIILGDSQQQYIYDLVYDEFKRLDHIVESLSWRESEVTIKKYVYASDEFVDYPQEIHTPENIYTIDPNGKICSLHPKRLSDVERLFVEYDELERLEHFVIDAGENYGGKYDYQFIYGEDGLLKEKLVTNNNGNKTNTLTYAYSDDGLTIQQIDDKATEDKTIITYLFDENYRLISQTKEIVTVDN